MADNKVVYQDIAAYFLAFANETGNLLTNLKLQKLVYYVQAWHLALYDKPVFEDDFEAWIHGPVLPDLFKLYQPYGYRPILISNLNEEVLSSLKQKFGIQLAELIDEVIEEYFGADAFALSQQTHAELPWQEARKDLQRDAPSHNIITKESMKSYYKQFVTA
jgi:uncharacterized phage-associated protein